MVRRHEFGPEGHAYVRRYLESGAGFGKRLGGLLLEHHDAERGLVWAFVRGDSPAEKLVDVEAGGLLPKFDPGWKEQADAWLRDRLVEGGGERALLVENPYAKPADWLEKDPDRRAVFCGDDVYEYYRRGRRASGLAGRSYVGSVRCVIAPTPENGLQNRQSLSPEVVLDIAVQAVAVMLGAWDDEAWLVWEPSQGPVR